MFEPWESGFQNACSFQLFLLTIVAMFLGSLWTLTFDNVGFASFVVVLLIVTMVVSPLIAILYLTAGVNIVSRRIALLTAEGVVTGALPLWIRGLRWETLDLPPGTVAITSMYEGAPSSQKVLDALNDSASMAKNRDESDEETGGREILLFLGLLLAHALVQTFLHI